MALAGFVRLLENEAEPSLLWECKRGTEIIVNPYESFGATILFKAGLKIDAPVNMRAFLQSGLIRPI